MLDLVQTKQCANVPRQLGLGHQIGFDQRVVANIHSHANCSVLDALIDTAFEVDRVRYSRFNFQQNDAIGTFVDDINAIAGVQIDFGLCFGPGKGFT